MKNLHSAIIGALACTTAVAIASAEPPHRIVEVVTFDPSLGVLPESITIDAAGRVFFSAGSTIRELGAGGQVSTFATLPIAAFALGVKVGADGCVYNTSTSLDPTVVGAFVWKTCSPGVAQPLAALDPTGGPNDLAFEPGGDLLVTDPFLGRVYRVSPQGGVQVWLSHPLLAGNPASPALLFHAIGVDGIALDERRDAVYLGNLDYGRIVRVPILADGSAGAPSVFVDDPRLVGADGLAFDDKGNLFVAVNAHDRLVRIAPSGTVSVLAEGGLLDGPSSVAFGRRPGDEHDLYIANSAFLRAFGLASGTPHPAILRTFAAHRGLPLP